MGDENVCLACDDNYAKYAGVVIASILDSANPDDSLCFYIYLCGFPIFWNFQ